jgi:hypothetical protein
MRIEIEIGEIVLDALPEGMSEEIARREISRAADVFLRENLGRFERGSIANPSAKQVKPEEPMKGIGARIGYEICRELRR